MSNKFIPSGDTALFEKARGFTTAVVQDPSRFGLKQSEADALQAAFAAFETSFRAVRTGGRQSEATTRVKDTARAELERHMRRIRLIVLAKEDLDPAAKINLGIPERTRPKTTLCPQEAPQLRFIRAHHDGNGAVPRHELVFSGKDMAYGKKPAGAARLELFVDLVPPEAAVPGHPGDNHAGRPWYLRSFTRSPIKLIPPMARVPMRVVYWGRWCDAAGNVGPFSATAAGWLESASEHLLALSHEEKFLGGEVHRVSLKEPTPHEISYSVELREARVRATLPELVGLPDGVKETPKQIEGPVGEAA